MTIIQKTLYWFYYSKILTLKNRLKSLSKKEMLQFTIVFIVGIILLYIYLIKSQTHDGNEIILISQNRIMWACTLFPLAKLLFTSIRIKLTFEDEIIVSITRLKVQIWFIYTLLKKISQSIWWTTIISLCFAYTANSWKAFPYAFIGIWLYLFMINCICLLYKILKIKNNKIHSLTYSIILFISVFYIVMQIISDSSYPNILIPIIEPVFTVFTILFNQVQNFEFNYFPFILYSLVGGIALGGICTNFKNLSFPKKEEKRLTKKVQNDFDIDSDLLLIYNEITLFFKNILTLGGICQIISPSLVYIILSLYSIYTNQHQVQDETNIIGMTMLPFFSIIGFPSMFVLPFFRREKEIQWLYRLSNSYNKIIIIKLVSTSIYCILSISLSSIIIFSLSYWGLNTNYFSLIHIPSFLWIIILSPTMICSFGLLLSIYFPDAYINPNNNQLNCISMITLIWITGLISLPMIILLYIGITEYIYIILCAIYSFILTYIFYKLSCYYSKTKEI